MLAFAPTHKGLMMNSQMNHDMLEATRLTREGRLAEATLFLQRLLRGDAPDAARQPTSGAAPRSAAGVTIDLVPDSVHLADVEHSSRPGASDADERSRPFRLFQGLGGEAPAFLRRRPPSADGAVGRGTFITKSFANQAGTRTYKVYVPSGYCGEPVSLVVMLHGCTQSPDDFAAGTQMNALADEHHCLVVYPAQPQSANHSKCWNWFNPADQQRGSGEPSLIAGITSEVMRDYAVDPRRVYVAGLSAGGAAAAIMATAYPDLYAAVAVHSGLACGAAKDLPSAFAAMRQGVPGVKKPASSIPTIVFHGDADRTVHPKNGDDVLRRSEAFLDADLQRSTERGETAGGHRYTCNRHTDAAGRVMLEQWVIHGAGHAWSGGSAAGTYTDPRGPDASRIMLSFFLSHAKGGK